MAARTRHEPEPIGLVLPPGETGMMNREQVETEMRVIERLFQSLPDWNDTARLRGKLLTIRRAIADSSTDSSCDAVRTAVAELEVALIQMQRRDPLTLMVARVIAWRENLEHS